MNILLKIMMFVTCSGPSSPIGHPSIESETVLIEAAACPPCEATTVPYTHHIRVVPLGRSLKRQKVQTRGGGILDPYPRNL